MTAPLVHTYSIVARDRATGQLGVAVESHYFQVGPVVPWAEAGIGAVATQSRVKIDYGPNGVALMREGLGAIEALARLLQEDEQRELRQVAMVDAGGSVAVHTGAECIPAAGHLVGDGFSVQANLMVDDTVWPAMKLAYETAEGEFADRLVAALDAAQAAGGDIRGQQSAALLIVAGERQEQSWQGRLYDIRVEDHPRPVEELKRLVRIRQAYNQLGRAAELMAAQRYDEAREALRQGWDLAPGIVELKFWPAVNLFMAGREDEALALFREVFAREPIWGDLVPRLAPLGLLPSDPAALQRILAQRDGG